MLVINKYIPLKGYKAMAVYPFIFVKEGACFSERDLNHEKIHLAQQKELLLVGFYILYFIEWIVNIVRFGNMRKAYRSISFEQEAYEYEGMYGYRKPYGWMDYVK